jgi:hypothetical protein
MYLPEPSLGSRETKTPACKKSSRIRVSDTFGGQMKGIHDQMDRSMGAMTTVQQALQKLVEDITEPHCF